MDYDDAYLMHHGVKGMKWGVRRYRNYDGTLTNAGKAQRHKQSYKNGDSGRSGMSAKTKKRLATAAKVAGAAAAVGGAAYLAKRTGATGVAKSRLSGLGLSARDAVDSARNRAGDAASRFDNTKLAKGVDSAVNKVSNSKLANRVRNARDNASKKFNQYADKGESVVSNARTNAGKKFNQYADKGESVVADAKNRLSNSKLGKAASRAASGARTATGVAKSRLSGLGLSARDAASNTRERLSNARTNASKKFNQYAEKGQSVLEKRAAARSTPEARLKRSGNLVSSTSRIRDAASNARDKVSGAASRAASGARTATGVAKSRLSGLGLSARDAASNTRERLSNARTNASKKFNQYAEKGQSVLEKRAAARSTPEARLKRSGNLVSSTSRIRDAASNARDKVSGAASRAASGARTATGVAKSRLSGLGLSARDAASNARDRVSGAASNARDKVANSRVGKRIKADAEDIGKVASTTKSVVKSKYYTGTKSGRKKIADQTREAKHRTNQRRMYGAR